MLVLTRSVQQEIVIGNDITVRILRLRGGKVQVGIEAPKEIRVRRSELPERQHAAPDSGATIRLA